MFRNKYATTRDIVPQPEWEGIEGKISQRPDILTVDGPILYVLDAKYYNYNVGLLGWHDVIKQLFYRHTIIENLKGKKGARLLPNVKTVKNAFLLPGNETDKLKYIGRVFVRDIENLGEVKVLAINQWDAMRTYAFRNDDSIGMT
ncbi:hypothetical protein JOC73_002186 [Alkaliphilus hydrothermalis]|uniref:LlaJI restriction endonuclease n=1 Tax=Alkaliphilus hydrothermalis TaxID=1482730 RepID=A0ABS2NRQ6_9FIRM|nr:hypothetical protein [Alkaliphilus hydrothermalis]